MGLLPLLSTGRLINLHGFTHPLFQTIDVIILTVCDRSEIFRPVFSLPDPPVKCAADFLVLQFIEMVLVGNGLPSAQKGR